MFKYFALLPLAIMLALPASARRPKFLSGTGLHLRRRCRQRRQTRRQRTTWRCQDGRSYTGAFKNGKFDGQGVYTVSVNRETFIEPFNSNSTKFRNMVLSGTFKKGLAHGKFTASQNGETVLS